MDKTVVCALLITVLCWIYDPITAAKPRRDRASPRCQNITAQDIQNGVSKNIAYAPVVMKNKEYKVSASNGESVDIRCPIKGSPRVRVVWYFGDKIINSDDENVSVHKSTLSIRNLTYQYQGKYKCVATNRCGSAEWELAQEVIVHFEPLAPPLILLSPRNQTVEESSNVTIACKSFSGSTKMTWWKHYYQVNGSWTYPNGSSHWRRVKSNYDQLDELWLMKVTADDAGMYECIVRNEHGMSSRKQWLTVNPRTEPSVTAPEQNDLPWVLASTIGVTVTVVLGILVVYFCRKPKRALPKDNAINPLYPLIPPTEMKIIPYDERWEMPRDNLDIGEVIGEGFFGKVHKGIALGLFGRPEPVIVAVKTLKDNATIRELDTLVQEMNTMKSIGDHLNIINFLGCCTQDGPLYILVEYAPEGNLRDFLQKQKPGAPPVAKEFVSSPKYEQPQSKLPIECSPKPLTCKDLVSFSRQVARGMEYLSSKNIIHRDLAARNVLVAEGNILKIADFGLTRELREREYYTRQTETPLPIKWMAIECLRDRKYLPKSDVWSYGVLLWEIFTYGSNPYPALDLSQPESLCRWLAQGNRMDRPSHSPHEMYTLMLKCWRENTSERPTFVQLRENLDSILGSMSEEYLDLTEDDFCDPYFTSEADAAAVIGGTTDDCVFEEDAVQMRRGTKHSQRSDYSSLSTSSLDKSSQQSLCSQPSLSSTGENSDHSSGLDSLATSASSDSGYIPLPCQVISTGDSNLPSHFPRASDPGDDFGSAGEGGDSGDEEIPRTSDSLLKQANVSPRGQREQINTELLKMPSLDKDVCILGENHVPYANFYRTKTSDRYHVVELEPPSLS